LNAEYHTLEQKLERLKEQIIRLEQVKREIKSAADLKKDYAKEAMIERLFQIALEVVLDMGRMIISLENLPRPQDNDEIFQILAKAKIVSLDYAKKAFGMGRFRNILVHGYMIIDERRVFENLQKLELFTKFAEFVSRYLVNVSKK
jgi:uncharacterized protein YutE (UPF0331/DUF86 family)